MTVQVMKDPSTKELSYVTTYHTVLGWKYNDRQVIYAVSVKDGCLQ